jgi:hypothetical protein
MSRLARLIKDHIQKEIGFEKWLERYVTPEYVADDGEARIRCVAHDEETASCHFNTVTGLWKCQSTACGAEGDVISLYRYVHGHKTDGEAIQPLAIELGLISDLDDDLIDALHKALMDSETALNWALDALKVSAETLQRFKIGLQFLPDKREARLTIPVRGVSGLWEDIRRYNPKYTPKMLHWAKGHGGCRIFPFQVFHEQKKLFFFEGEKDTLRAHEFGVEGAFTVTAGVGTLPDEHGILFKDRTIYLCFDVDKAGYEGAEKVAQRLSAVAEAVFIIRLPSEGLPDNGDFSDWLNLGHTMEEWQRLVEEAEPVEIDPHYRFDRENENTDAQEVGFTDLLGGGLFRKPVRFQAHAMGSSCGLINFQVPTHIVLDCTRDQKCCKGCTLFRWDQTIKPWKESIDYRNEKTLQLFRVSAQQQDQAVRNLYGVPARCPALRLSTTDRAAMQHLIISPPVELSQMRETYTGYLSAYYHGAPIVDNRDYIFEGYLQADPKNQGAVLNLYSARPARNAIEGFTVTEDVTDAVEFFRPAPTTTLQDHFQELHQIIEEDIGIWGRYDVQQAVLEAIFSALHFYVGDREIENGWVEILVIGDTGTAKSTVSKRMMKMINVGEFISAETVSAAGLMGGVEYLDKVPIVRWGAYPRNNGGFVVLDEVDALQKKDKDITGQLTAMRTSGFAEVTKIAHARTQARVRALWITNPRRGTSIASLNGACRALFEIVQDAQDIARFTKVYAVAADSVTIEEITKPKQRTQHPILHKHWNTLAMLVWSLGSDQVRFSEEAQEFLRTETRRLTGKYHEEIPLLEKGRTFDKLAKLSVPVAALCGSFEMFNEKITLMVERCHCEYAIWHLEKTYDDPAMRYDEFSQMAYTQSVIADEDEVAAKLLACPVPLERITRFFMLYGELSRNQFRELIGMHMAADDIWACLLQNNCLRLTKGNDTAAKTAAFARFLDRINREGAPKTKSGARKGSTFHV